MIEVQHLTKRYGPVTAVDDVNFRVERGEILGFLGPNGAGKTTTMRMLAGYMPPTEGKAVVAGHDVFHEPIEAKRKTGYLLLGKLADHTAATFTARCLRLLGAGDREAALADLRRLDQPFGEEAPAESAGCPGDRAAPAWYPGTTDQLVT